MNKEVLTVLALSFASAALADDFRTTDGKVYKDAIVNRVEPDGVVVKTKSGISKLYFAELPKDVQERFGYDPQKASAYSAEQAANYAVYQKQQEQVQRQQEVVAAQKKATFAQQQSVTNRFQVLQDRYAALQHQEDDLLLRIGEAKKPGPAYRGGKNNKTLLHSPNPQASQLPLLQSHLKDVRHEKDQIRKQLEKAQR
ncbi:MAG: hypothetical protein WCE87_03310 [Candidatus Udaeobacter sp.]